MDYDLIIIGGGIGGSAMAATMARAGAHVLLLEKSMVYEDRVRGEWIAPWGVSEVKRLGLYDLLRGAGGWHLDAHITFDESRAPDESRAKPLPLGIFAADVPGPLCIGHPHHCRTLFDEAGRAGAETLRGVDVTEITLGTAPAATFTHAGAARRATARLIIGADGRTSVVRDAAKIALHQDKPHHMFAGLLVDGADGWNEKLQAIGTEGDFAFLAFPQGEGRVRVYGAYGLDQRARFAGPDGARAFLDAFRMECAPENEHIARGAPAGPLLAYFNNDSWTEEPFVEGAVLIGDAAGWNDPIIGLGLSITYRDVRIVSDILTSSPDWRSAAFRPYAEERIERMRRLRFAASLTSALDCEFGPAAAARRRRYHQLQTEDATIGAHAFAVMAGPETLPGEVFTAAHRARVLGAET
ncbi:MAG: NAD(P)-binding protein [Alphaproteobacteria bacterium]|nr:NAD(P)-binding protein [Alphaproteobacteria bacterium]